MNPESEPVAPDVSGRVAGKAAIVVGAGSIGPGWGNGKAAAVLLAREGASVVCVDRDGAAAQETAAIIAGEGGAAVAVEADAADEADVRRYVETCRDRFGRIDILHNNVGIAVTGAITELTEAEWDRVMAVNLKSCFLAMKAVIPTMVAQGGGSIVNTSSIAAIRHLGPDYPTYYASKAAVSHLTRTTAVQYAAQRVRVNAVLPGLMRTPMVEHTPGLVAAYGGDVEAMWAARAAQVPMKVAGDAWDVAFAVLYLASDESRYVTGVELVVDGGMTLKSN